MLTDRRVGAVAAVTVPTSATSIGLYTYVAPLLTATLHATKLTGYLWIWGLGGLAGSLLVGRLIDAWRDTRMLVTAILAVLGATLAPFPVAGSGSAGAMVLLLVWGAAGWGSLAPQQHRMLALRGPEGPVAVSLNASALYLGSAIGAAVGGALLGGGLPVTALAVVLGAVALVTAGLNRVITPGSAARTPVLRP